VVVKQEGRRSFDIVENVQIRSCFGCCGERLKMRTVWEQHYKLGLCTFDVADPGRFLAGQDELNRAGG
jgi:hypothetical protein